MKWKALALGIALSGAFAAAVSVAAPVASLTAALPDTIYAKPGDTFRVGSPSSHFKWTSTDERVVSVTPSGYVKAIAPGSAWLKVSYQTLADSVLVVVRDMTPPVMVTGLAQQVTAVVDSLFAFQLSWTASPSAVAYAVRSNFGDSATVSTTSRTIKAPRVYPAPFDTVCVTALSSSGVASPAACVPVAVPEADSVVVLGFPAGSTTYAQGLKSIVLDSIGKTMPICAYGWVGGKVISDAKITITSSPDSVATFTPGDPATYTADCLTKLPGTSIWPLP